MTRRADRTTGRYVDPDGRTVTLVCGTRSAIVPGERGAAVVVPCRTTDGVARLLTLDRVQHLDLVTALLVALREVDVRDRDHPAEEEEEEEEDAP